jgi:hypothetical protein
VPRVHDQWVYLARPPRGRMVCKGGWLLPGAAARQASDARRATRRDPPDRSRCAGNLVETASPGAPPSLASLAKAHRPKVSEATASRERRAASWPKPKLSRWVTTGTSSSPASLKAALCLGQRGPARLPASPRRAGGRIQAVALRQALIDGEKSGPARPLDMEAIKRRARQAAGLTPVRAMPLLELRRELVALALALAGAASLMGSTLPQQRGSGNRVADGSGSRGHDLFLRCRVDGSGARSPTRAAAA